MGKKTNEEMPQNARARIIASLRLNDCSLVASVPSHKYLAYQIFVILIPPQREKNPFPPFEEEMLLPPRRDQHDTESRKS